MSGMNKSVYYAITEYLNEFNKEIKENKISEDGEIFIKRFDDDVISLLKRTSEIVRIVSDLLFEADYLLDFDIGEEEFKEVFFNAIKNLKQITK